MIVQYPSGCTTEASKLSFCYKLKEELRLEHNQKVIDLSEADFKTYIDNIFEPKMISISEALQEAKNNAGSGTYWNPINLSTAIV